MNKSVIYNCIEFPQGRAFTYENELKEVTTSYPYFQTAQILLAFSLKSNEDYRFSNQIRKTSIQTYDRKALWYLLNEEKKSISNEIEEKKIEIVLEKNTINDLTENVGLLHEEDSKKIETQPPATSLLKAEEKNHPKEDTIKKESSFHTFSEWLQLQKAGTNSNVPKVAIKTIENPQNSNELIEKFIQTEPRISKPTKATFFSPQVMAKKSIEENDEIVSETLANIYAAQGDVQRATKVYKKLGLLNPEKSAYFAALIKKLENTELT
jgi:hypothetical protein